ncbi:MAG: hypothetical protein M2R45_00911 [Verrucomicrobia subdivision 3 bacterium]|nr:hypothetical protein [Limisphaerales bacterium]MCS1414580.1 hypothetical protein [Limisphaerales bacterium]
MARMGLLLGKTDVESPPEDEDCMRIFVWEFRNKHRVHLRGLQTPGVASQIFEALQAEWMPMPPSTDCKKGPFRYRLADNGGVFYGSKRKNLWSRLRSCHWPLACGEYCKTPPFQRISGRLPTPLYCQYGLAGLGWLDWRG